MDGVQPVPRKRDTISISRYQLEQIVPPRFRSRIVLTRDPDGEERCVAYNLCAVAYVLLVSISTTKAERRRWTLVSRDFPRQLFTLYFLQVCEEACPATANSDDTNFELAGICTVKTWFIKRKLIDFWAG